MPKYEETLDPATVLDSNSGLALLFHQVEGGWVIKTTVSVVAAVPLRLEWVAVVVPSWLVAYGGF